jgi:hypothetical protein
MQGGKMSTAPNFTLELERTVLGGIMRHGLDPVRPVRLSPQDFATPAHGETLVWLDRHRDKWIAGNEAACQASLEAAGITAKLGSQHGAVFELFAVADHVVPASLAELAVQLVCAGIDRRRREAAGRFERDEMGAEEFAARMRELDARLDDLDARASACHVAEVLDARRFDHENPPPEPPVLFAIGEAKISTPGNLTNVSSQAKAGKSALLGGMLAAAMNPEAEQSACLGFRAENPEGKTVLHFDTEQSRYDHFLLVTRALRRAGLDAPPPFLRSYCITDLPIRQRREALWREMDRAGDIFAVMLDGVADLTIDPNNPEEAFGFVAELHARAIAHNCAIVTILHENPGTETGKTRGHLGSQLERKAETLLRLEKRDEITTLWAHMARHCSLPKSGGLRFAWSGEAGMHVLVDSANDARSKAAGDDLMAFAASCFEGKTALTWAALRDRIAVLAGIKPKSAIHRLERMRQAGIIQKNLIHQWEFAA